MKNNLILIGFMGCGKSSVGRRLAALLDWPFLDTDAWIEERQGCGIGEIFARQGEAAFRRMETECLRALLREPGGKVIAVGGGLPVREENRALLKKLGRTVYLKVEADILYERLKTDVARPLLRTKDPRQKIASLLSEREIHYLASADKVISAGGLDVEAAAQACAEIGEGINHENPCNQRP